MTWNDIAQGDVLLWHSVYQPGESRLYLVLSTSQLGGDVRLRLFNLETAELFDDMRISGHKVSSACTVIPRSRESQ